MSSGLWYLAAGQPAHDQVLVLQPVVLVLLRAVNLGSAGPLEPSEGGPGDLGPEGVHDDGLRALDLTAAERAALPFRLLEAAGENTLSDRYIECFWAKASTLDAGTFTGNGRSPLKD